MPNCCTLHILPFQLSLSRFIFILFPQQGSTMDQVCLWPNLGRRKSHQKVFPSSCFTIQGNHTGRANLSQFGTRPRLEKDLTFSKNKFSWVGAPFTKTTMTLVIIHIIIWKIGSNISCVTKDCSRPWLVLIILVSAFLFKHCHFICRVAGVGDCVKNFCCHYVSCLVVGFHWKLFQSWMTFALRKPFKRHLNHDKICWGYFLTFRRWNGRATSATLNCNAMQCGEIWFEGKTGELMLGWTETVAAGIRWGELLTTS